ncbi:LuxR C-terminal-related transcriptional regulator [Granulicella paludicola]|uniref:LuxR C-terminal-related transcriptional regulator n=1 Tax=Granulicella paludicola TaxID=474951 RepID=UPI0037C13028
MTPREINLSSKVAPGRSNKIIGSELSIAKHPVKANLKIILAKLGASDRTHAVTVAMERPHGLNLGPHQKYTATTFGESARLFTRSDASTIS